MRRGSGSRCRRGTMTRISTGVGIRADIVFASRFGSREPSCRRSFRSSSSRHPPDQRRRRQHNRRTQHPHHPHHQQQQQHRQNQRRPMVATTVSPAPGGSCGQRGRDATTTMMRTTMRTTTTTTELFRRMRRGNRRTKVRSLSKPWNKEAPSEPAPPEKTKKQKLSTHFQNTHTLENLGGRVY